MTTTISGSTGVNKITDDAITAAKLPVGSVLQVVTSILNSPVTFSSSGYSQSGLSVTITPKKVNSRFIIQIWGTSEITNTTNQSAHDYRLIRGSTVVVSNSWQSYFNRNNNGVTGDNYPPMDLTCIDEPATLSAITYDFQGRKYSGTQASWIFAANNGGSSLGIITVTEIAQ